MNLRLALWIIATAMLTFVWNYSWAQTPLGLIRPPLEQLPLPPGEAHIYGGN